MSDQGKPTASEAIVNTWMLLQYPAVEEIIYQLVYAYVANFFDKPPFEQEHLEDALYFIEHGEVRPKS